jgi:hypothetical protein
VVLDKNKLLDQVKKSNEKVKINTGMDLAKKLKEAFGKKVEETKAPENKKEPSSEMPTLGTQSLQWMIE